MIEDAIKTQLISYQRYSARHGEKAADAKLAVVLSQPVKKKSNAKVRRPSANRGRTKGKAK